MDLRTQVSRTDPALGNCTVYRGDRKIILVLAPILAAGVALTGWRFAEGMALGRLLELIAWMCVLASLPVYQGLCAWRTELVIGDNGFRYVRPLRRTREALWSAVRSFDLEGEGRYQHIAVSYSEPTGPATVHINNVRGDFFDISAAARKLASIYASDCRTLDPPFGETQHAAP